VFNNRGALYSGLRTWGPSLGLDNPCLAPETGPRWFSACVRRDFSLAPFAVRDSGTGLASVSTIGLGVQVGVEWQKLTKYEPLHRVGAEHISFKMKS
jgi:hypothetical protein